MEHRISITVRIACVALTALLPAALTGCRGERSESEPRQFFPDMDDQYKVKAQSESLFYEEYLTDEEEDNHFYGRSMRMPVDGTVAFGYKPYTYSVENVDFSRRAEMLQADRVYYEGLNEDGTPVEYMPLKVTHELIEQGREQFNIYCIVCHGGTGMGDGMVGQRWSYPLPSWHDAQYLHGGEKGQDGHIFRTIRYGVENPGGQPYQYKMRPYASKVTVEESWAIVAYIRAIQRAYQGDVNELPPADRSRFSIPSASSATPSSNTSQETSS